MRLFVEFDDFVGEGHDLVVDHSELSSNETAEGRAANRRVDLVVLGAASLKLETQTPNDAVK